MEGDLTPLGTQGDIEQETSDYTVLYKCDRTGDPSNKIGVWARKMKTLEL